jgi:hypothetical protein
VIVELRIARGTAEQWAAENPVLGEGEPALELTTNRMKVGDGVTPWNSLGYVNLGDGGGGGGDGTVLWSQIVDKPTTFPPSAHQHTAQDIVNLTARCQSDVAAMIQAGAGISTSFNATTGVLTIAATGSGGGTLDAEAVRDTIGAALRGAGLITVTVNDAADTITVSTTATQNSTDAQLRDRGTHTGTQPISSVDQLQSTLDGKQDAGWVGAMPGMAWYGGFNSTTNTWQAPATSRTDIHREWIGGDVAHPPPGRSLPAGTPPDIWTRVA